MLELVKVTEVEQYMLDEQLKSVARFWEGTSTVEKTSLSCNDSFFSLFRKFTC